jgi:hypothetical protein
MTANAHRLADEGHLRDGVDPTAAADVLWTLSSPELYDLLVRHRGWDVERYGDFVAEGILAQLCRPTTG